MNPIGARRVLRLALAISALVPAALAWELIALPFRNPQQIVGILANDRFHPVTNAARFAVFVAMPSLVWLALAPLGRWPIASTGPASVMGTDRSARVTLGGLLVLGFATAAVLGLARLAAGTTDFYFDLFHDGDSLAPTLNWLARGHLWTEQQLTRGAVHDVFLPIAGWRLFGARTIGAFKAFQLLLEATVPLALWGLTAWLQHSLRGEVPRSQRALLLAVTLALLSAGQWYGTVWFQARALIMLTWLAILIQAIRRQTPGWFTAAGIAALGALLTTTESGVYAVATSLVVLGESASRGPWLITVRRAWLPWLAGFSVGHALILLMAGSGEWLAWWNQIASTASQWDFIYGYQYPKPWPLYAAHAWPVVVLALILLVLVVRAASSHARLERNGFGIHLTLVTLSVIAYRTALGRSDAAHLSQGIAYASLGLGYTIWLLSRGAPRRVRQGIVAMATIVMLGVTAASVHRHGWLNLAGAPAATLRYARLPNQAFLSPPEQQALPVIARAVQNASCVFVFPNEPGWYYLLGKPTCGRFHFTVHAAARDDQLELVRILERNRPPAIIYSSPLASSDVDGLSNRIRLARVEAWIQNHYRPVADAAGWSLYEPR